MNKQENLESYIAYIKKFKTNKLEIIRLAVNLVKMNTKDYFIEVM